MKDLLKDGGCRKKDNVLMGKTLVDELLLILQGHLMLAEAERSKHYPYLNYCTPMTPLLTRA